MWRLYASLRPYPYICFPRELSVCYTLPSVLIPTSASHVSYQSVIRFPPSLSLHLLPTWAISLLYASLRPYPYIYFPRELSVCYTLPSVLIPTSASHVSYQSVIRFPPSLSLHLLPTWAISLLYASLRPYPYICFPRELSVCYTLPSVLIPTSASHVSYQSVIRFPPSLSLHLLPTWAISLLYASLRPYPYICFPRELSVCYTLPSVLIPTSASHVSYQSVIRFPPSLSLHLLPTWAISLLYASLRPYPYICFPRELSVCYTLPSVLIPTSASHVSYQSVIRFPPSLSLHLLPTWAISLLYASLRPYPYIYFPRELSVCYTLPSVLIPTSASHVSYQSVIRFPPSLSLHLLPTWAISLLYASLRPYPYICFPRELSVCYTLPSVLIPTSTSHVSYQSVIRFPPSLSLHLLPTWAISLLYASLRPYPYICFPRELSVCYTLPSVLIPTSTSHVSYQSVIDAFSFLTH